MDNENRIPGAQQREEQNRIRFQPSPGRILRNLVCILLAAVAAAALLVMLFLPVLKVYSPGMEPLLTEGDVVIALKSGDLAPGDVAAFTFDNKILIKRVIAREGDWVDIDADGTVYVNHVAVDEPYLTERAPGDCNIELPCQVPASGMFVMGDNRIASVDSRNTAVGCLTEDQIVGKIMFCVWPISRFGPVK